MRKYMKLLLSFLMFIIPFITKAQDTLIRDGKMIIEYIDSAQGLSKDQIYTKTKEWFAKTFTNSQNVIQSSEIETGKVIAKGVTDVYLTNGVEKGKHFSDFIIEVTCRDGKYRLLMYDFKLDGKWSAEVIRDLMEEKPKYKDDYGSYFTSLKFSAAVLHGRLKKEIFKKDDF